MKPRPIAATFLIFALAIAAFFFINKQPPLPTSAPLATSTPESIARVPEQPPTATTTPAPTPTSSPSTATQATGLAISGTVTDLDFATPLPNVRVTLADPKTTHSLFALTAPNGTYTLDGLPEHAPVFRLVAHRDGYVPAFVQTQSHDAANPIDFSLERAGTVLVRVADFQNNPIPGAAVQIKDLTGLLPAPAVFTDSAGHAVVKNISRAAPPRIAASLPDRPHTDPAEAKPRFGDSLNARLELRLRSAADDLAVAYFGVVRDSKGNPLPDINVSFVSKFPSTPDQTTITTANGAYRLHPKKFIPRAALKAHAPSWGARSQHAPAPDPSNPSFPIEVNFSLDRGNIFRGRVINRANQPIPGAVIDTSVGDIAEVNSDPAFPRLLIDPLPDATTAADGSFILHDLPGKRLMLRVSAPGYSTKSHNARAGEAAEIQLDPAVSLIGAVIDASTKHPIEKFNVLLRHPRAMHEFLVGTPHVENPTQFRDPNGKFEFPNLNNGQKYQLLASAKGYSQKFLRDVNPVPSSKYPITIELHAAKTVTFRFIDKITQEPIRHASIITGFAAQNQTPGWVSIESINDELIGGKISTPDHNAEITLEEGPTPILLYVAAPGYTNLSIFPFDREKYREKITDAPDHFTVPLSKGATLFGTVYFNGAPAPHVNLRLGPATPTGYFSQQIFTDGEGQYEFNSLPPLDFILSADKMFDRTGVVSLSKKVSIPPGDSQRVNIGDDLGTSALFGLLLADSYPIPRMSINLTPQFPWDYQGLACLSESDGSYKFMGLKDGMYKISFGRTELIPEIFVEVKGLTPRDLPLARHQPPNR